MSTRVLLTGSGTLLDALERVLVASGRHEVDRLDHDELTDASNGGAIVIAAFDHPAKRELELLEDACGAGTSWVPLRWQDGKAHLGPAVAPGGTAGFRDLVGRRLAAARDEQADALSWTGAAGRPVLTGAELAWIASTAVDHIDRWAADACGAEITNAEVELDATTPSVQRHPVLPLPDRRDCPVTADPDDLVDAQTGIVLGVRDLVGDERLMPPGLHLAVAEVADMRRLFDWPNDRRAFGSSWEAASAARGAAIGEGVERYCGNWPSPRAEIVSSTFESLAAEGERAVDPDELALYSPRQHQTQGFPFVPFHRDSRAAWVRGWSLTREEAVWVPAFLAYVSWRHHCPEEPRYCFPNLTGVAAGTSLDSATVSGLEEVIERDASMTWWSHETTLAPMELPDDVRRRARTVGDRFETRVLALPNTFGLPVAAGIVRDRETGWLTIGTAVRPSFTDAALKALAEGYSLQQSCRSLADEATFSRIVRANVQSARNLKPWRRDRSYLAAYRADFHDVVDLMCQLQVNLDDRAVEHLSDRVWSDLSPVPAPRCSLPSRTLDPLRHSVERQGFEVIRVDLTTSDVEAAGLRVVRAVVPGLVANFPAAFPMWGRERISRAGRALGLSDAPLGEGELSTFPMPHA